MNCVSHPEQVAVGACSECSAGLCQECFQTSQRQGNKPVCKPCAINLTEAYIAEISAALGNVNKKKIICSVIFVIGAILVIVGFVGGIINGEEVFGNSSIDGLITGIIVWSVAGFTDRLKQEKPQQSTKDAMEEALFNRDFNGWGWVINYSIKFFFWIVRILIRGAFFPIFYAIFMINGSRNLKNELNQAKTYRESLNSL